VRSTGVIALAGVLALTAACSGSSGKSSTPTPSATATTSGTPTAAGYTTPVLPGASTGGTLAKDLATAAALCKTSNANEIKGFFGGSVEDGSTFTPDNSTATALPTCHWRIAGSNLGSDGSVLISAAPNISDPQKFAAAQANLPGALPDPSVGDQAFYSAALNSLFFRKDGKAYLVQGIFGTNGAPDPDPVKIHSELSRLANAMSGRL
jgi:hypothetical protein